MPVQARLDLTSLPEHLFSKLQFISRNIIMTQSQYRQASREALADAIIDAKVRKNLSFEQLNQGTGLSRPLL